MVYNLLRGKIADWGLKYNIKDYRAAFCKKMGFSLRTLDNKLSGVREWKVPEMLKAVEILEIPQDQVNIFFYLNSSESGEKV